MSTFYMLTGLPGSGKSTFIQKYKTPYSAIVSTDEIRRIYFDDENSQEHNKQVFHIANKNIRTLLDSGYDVYFDATNLTRKNRAYTLNQIPSNNSKVSIFVDTPLKQCLLYNQNRTRQVPEEIIKKMNMSLEIPALEEGFDKLYLFQNNKLLKDAKENKEKE